MGGAFLQSTAVQADVLIPEEELPHSLIFSLRLSPQDGRGTARLHPSSATR